MDNQLNTKDKQEIDLPSVDTSKLTDGFISLGKRSSYQEHTLEESGKLADKLAAQRDDTTAAPETEHHSCCDKQAPMYKNMIDALPPALDTRLGQMIAWQAELQQADRDAIQDGFDGGLQQAYHHHMAHYCGCLHKNNPQAQAIIEDLTELWDQRQYCKALQYANRVFGKMAKQHANAEQASQEHILSNSNLNRQVQPFASRAEYNAAKNSPDPKERLRAERAWRQWMSEYQKNPASSSAPFPL